MIYGKLSQMPADDDDADDDVGRASGCDDVCALYDESQQRQQEWRRRSHCLPGRRSLSLTKATAGLFIHTHSAMCDKLHTNEKQRQREEKSICARSSSDGRAYLAAYLAACARETRNANGARALFLSASQEWAVLSRSAAGIFRVESSSLQLPRAPRAA